MANAAIEPRSDQDRLGIALASMTQRLRESTARNELETWLKAGQAELLGIMRGEL